MGTLFRAVPDIINKLYCKKGASESGRHLKGGRGNFGGPNFVGLASIVVGEADVATLYLCG